MENGREEQRENGHSQETKRKVSKALEKPSTVINEVEDFIRRFHDGDSVVTSNAQKMIYTIPKESKLGLTSTRQKSYADLLGWAIAAYQFHKDTSTDHERLLMAYELLDEIERGRTHGVIKDNIKQVEKFKYCQDENKQLKETKIQLEAEILKLKEENEELHKALENLGGKRISTVKSGNRSPIVKCSHCGQILSIDDFDLHKCEWTFKDVQQIPVVYFRDDSFNDKKVMTGYGLDGVLYTFVVTPRTPIPYMRGLSDDSYHDSSNRRKVNRTCFSVLLPLRRVCEAVCFRARVWFLVSGFLAGFGVTRVSCPSEGIVSVCAP